MIVLITRIALTAIVTAWFTYGMIKMLFYSDQPWFWIVAAKFSLFTFLIIFKIWIIGAKESVTKPL